MTNETHSSSITHIILTLIAILGLALFILACRPSWSPDSQKVVYSYWDDGSKKAAVAVFDRRTRTSSIIFEWWDETSSGSHLAPSQWTKDGERIIVTIYMEQGVQLLAMPLNPRAPAHAYTLKKMDDDMSPLPYPQNGKNLFLSSGKTVVRVNLETGEILRKEAEEELDCLLYDAGDKVFYLKGIKGKEPQAKRSEETKSGETKSEPKEQNKSEEVKAYEFGELDQKDLTLHSWLNLPSEELKAKGIDGLTGFADVNLKNLKLAVVEEAPDGKPSRILVIGKSGLEQLIEVGIKDRAYELGNPQWSPDGKIVFVAALIRHEQSKTTEFAVLEVPLDGRSTRIDRIEERPSQEFNDEYLSNVQIALSPDGKFIAATNGHLEDVRPERRGLFLLDVSKRDRPANFYPAPALPAAAKSAQKE